MGSAYFWASLNFIKKYKNITTVETNVLIRLKSGDIMMTTQCYLFTNIAISLLMVSVGRATLTANTVRTLCQGAFSANTDGCAVLLRGQSGWSVQVAAAAHFSSSSVTSAAGSAAPDPSLSP